MTYFFVWKVKTSPLPFSRTLSKRDLSKFADHNSAQILHFHCRLYDLFFVSRSQVCQKYKLQIVLFRSWFRFLYTVV